jgi:hypothetical protein
MKTQRLRHPRNLITFSKEPEALAVALAKLGQSDSVIMEECNYSPGQISYRLRKAQGLEGLEGGYRRSWAKGTSEVCQMVKRDLVSILKKEIQRSLPPLIKHPEPVFVKTPEHKAPTIDQAVEELKKRKVAVV